jgi:hypothetical protein
MELVTEQNGRMIQSGNSELYTKHSMGPLGKRMWTNRKRPLVSQWEKQETNI